MAKKKYVVVSVSDEKDYPFIGTLGLVPREVYLDDSAAEALKGLGITIKKVETGVEVLDVENVKTPSIESVDLKGRR